jgi:hypothetical protein
MEASMMLKGRMSRTILNVSFFALDLSLVLYLSFQPAPGKINSRQPVLAQSHVFVETSKPNNIPSSIHLKDSLVFPIIQQPGGKPNFVSTNSGEITQFSSASQYGNIGLLAHNYLSGKTFFQLSVGQQVHVTYGDGTTETFVVSEILQYQALDPENPFSSFQNVSNKNEILTAQQMFERVYEGNRHITFQTCISKNGESSWGRLFVVAVPEVTALGFVH